MRIIKSLFINKSLNISPSQMGELNENCNWEEFETLCFERVSPFIFDGILAELVSRGGIFFKSKKKLKHIVELARIFSDSIIQGYYNSFIIYQVTEGWSGYFGNMGFDNTFVIFDENNGEFWVMAKTDFD
ncbi:hypothetical protein [Pedobacter psychrophilus]|nr:hypothetical protein [Pedobacter psychrophilus]